MFDDAKKCYDKVLNSTPVYKLVYPNYANLMLAMDDNSNAIKYGKIGLKECESVGEKANCAFNISAGYYNLDSCDLSMKYFAEVKKLKNNNLLHTYFVFKVDKTSESSRKTSVPFSAVDFSKLLINCAKSLY